LVVWSQPLVLVTVTKARRSAAAPAAAVAVAGRLLDFAEGAGELVESWSRLDEACGVQSVAEALLLLRP
jgi:hypothetical protein